MANAVSSAVSSAASSAASPSSTACTTNFSEFPTKDVACLVSGGTSGVNSSYSDILKGCCKDAPVEKLDNDCALWCLASGQSVGDLQKCWQDGGINGGSIQCNSNSTATATGKVSGTSGSGAKETGSQTSGGASSGTNSPGAAPMVMPQGVSKAGLGMLAMILGSAVFGALL